MKLRPPLQYVRGQCVRAMFCGESLDCLENKIHNAPYVYCIFICLMYVLERAILNPTRKGVGCRARVEVAIDTAALFALVGTGLNR